jgi:hypothetical protein
VCTRKIVMNSPSFWAVATRLCDWKLGKARPTGDKFWTAFTCDTIHHLILSCGIVISLTAFGCSGEERQRPQRGAGRNQDFGSSWCMAFARCAATATDYPASPSNHQPHVSRGLIRRASSPSAFHSCILLLPHCL